jgi:hypothetical protein
VHPAMASEAMIRHAYSLVAMWMSCMPVLVFVNSSKPLVDNRLTAARGAGRLILPARSYSIELVSNTRRSLCDVAGACGRERSF